MTPVKAGSKTINLDHVTWVSEGEWTEALPDGRIEQHTGLIVHFVGGSALRVTGADAAALRKALDL